MARVLLVDDDEQLTEMLLDFLRPERMEVTTCPTGEQGLASLRAGEFDLLVLDIMLPGMDGLEVLKSLRQFSNIPVIMLTARGDDVDRIIGLEFGADDYLAKPFNPRELLARIKAILRRAPASKTHDQRLTVGSIQLDPQRRRVRVADSPLTLTGTEFEILRCLLESPGLVVSKDELSERALGRRLMPYDRSIDTHISNLRGKLLRAGAEAGTIDNQRGVGYVLLPGSA